MSRPAPTRPPLTPLRALVPAAGPRRVRVSACLRPYGGEGGDFYDLISTDPDHLGIFIGDVSGHGPRVAAIARTVRTRMREQAHRYGGTDPVAMLASLDHALSAELPRQSFVTAIFGILHGPTGAFRFARAGHCPPLRITPRGVTPLETPGVALGLGAGSLFRDELQEERVVLSPGERLLLHTDGLCDSGHPTRGPYGRDRLTASVRRSHGIEGTEAWLEAVLRDWRHHLGDRPPSDDVTLIGLHRLSGFSGPRCSPPVAPSPDSTVHEGGL